MTTNYQECKIHESAIIEKGAELGHGVEIGPFSIIGANVKLADGVQVDSHVVVRGKTTIGERTKICRFASVGTKPQDLKYKGEDTELIVGSDNDIREYANLSIGTDHGGGVTRVGNNNLLMVSAHIGHDAQIGDHCVLANSAGVAGHVEIDDRAILGGHVGLHQFCKIGKHAMIAGGSIVVQDVMPYTLVQGNHAVTRSLNLVGLKRAGFSREDLKLLKDMFRLVFRTTITMDVAVEKIYALKGSESIKEDIIKAIRGSTRGFSR